MKNLKHAFVATIPVLSGYIVLGIGYGMIMASKGFGIGWSVAMSLFLFAGTMQFVAIGLFTGGASLLTVALTTLAVNARHLFYGISMVDKYKGVPKKPFLIFALSDETYALVSNDLSCKGMTDDEKKKFYFHVSLFDYCYWTIGTALGSLAGAALSFNTTGIDFALTALFVSVFVEQWLTTRDHTAGIVGVLASLVCLLIVGPDNFLIPAMILITLTLTLMRKKKGITNEEVDHE